MTSTALAVLLAAAAAGEPLPAVGSQGAAPPVAAKHVLAIYWYGRDFAANVEFERGLRSALSSAGAVDYYAEYLETDRFAGARQAAILRDYLREKYVDRHIDVVITEAEIALKFALENRREIFPGVPIVAFSFHRRDFTTLGETGVTGVVVNDVYRKTADLLLSLHPATTQVLVVIGGAEKDENRALEALVRDELEGLTRRATLTYLINLPLDDLLARTTSAPPGSVILYIRQSQDYPSARFGPVEVLAMMARSTRVPIYGVSRSYVGAGSVGGYVIGHEAVGRQIAGMAIRIVSGEPAESIPPASAGLVPMFDWRQLKRFAIPQNQLPAGSAVLFREATVWEQYRRYVIAAIAVCSAQFLLIAGLLVQHVKRRRAEMALRASSERNRELAGRLITAQEEERRRIARELHDDVGQRIATLSIGLSALKRRHDTAEESLHDEFARLQKQIVSLSDDLRQLSHELHPSALEYIGLIEALKKRCDEVSSETGVNVRLDVSDAWQDVGDDIALCLYRVAQEGLRNVARHAHAETARVSLFRQDGDVVMRIADDGHGFEPRSRTAHAGLGLVSLGERVRMLGGRFDVQTSPDGGTVLAVSIPAGDSQAAEGTPRRRSADG